MMIRKSLALLLSDYFSFVENVNVEDIVFRTNKNVFCSYIGQHSGAITLKDDIRVYYTQLSVIFFMNSPMVQIALVLW